MLKLKGQTESGEWVEFGIDEIWGTNKAKCILNGDFPKTVLLTDTIKLADDPRKAMLDEIREKINNLTEYKSFVRVEGDPVPTLPQIAKWCVIWILDEMEAKL